MNPPDDARQAALERLLARREPLVPSAAMRSRTLAAVDGALAAPAVAPVRDDMRVALSACAAVALTLALLVVTIARPVARSSGTGGADGTLRPIDFPRVLRGDL